MHRFKKTFVEWSKPDWIDDVLSSDANQPCSGTTARYQTSKCQESKTATDTKWHAGWLSLKQISLRCSNF
ncbi:hypothetical protein N9M41_08050, partial [Rhodopirellula sp.]|nr:hypothetical protein [Rhodopirellula sp.]